MKKILITALVNIIFLIHLAVVVFVVFGGFFPEIWKWYLLVTTLTLVLDIILGYCFLSKWEFVLRKKLNPKINYDYSFSSFYLEKLTKNRISENFVQYVFITFLCCSIVITVLFNIILK